ncbi:hypothetical protein BJX62DRAFT_217693 [Aspergillus germanicus]
MTRYVSQGPRFPALLYESYAVHVWKKHVVFAQVLRYHTNRVGQTFHRCSTAAVPLRQHAHAPLCSRIRLASLLTPIIPERLWPNRYHSKSKLPFSPQWRRKGDFLTSEPSTLEPRVHPASSSIADSHLRAPPWQKTDFVVDNTPISRVIAVDLASPRPNLLSGR